MEETVSTTGIREPTEAPTDQQSNLQSKYISALEQKLEAFEKDAKKHGEKSSDTNDREPDYVPKLTIDRIEPGKWRAIKSKPGLRKGGALLVTLSTGTGYLGKEGLGKPNRLAINSEVLLEILSTIAGEPMKPAVNVLVRPFRHLVIYEAQIRKALADAEQRCLHPQPTPINAIPSVELKHTDRKEDIKEKSDCATVLKNRPERARDELKCLVEFMDLDIADIFDIRKRIQSLELKDIPFEFLWLLFSPGDLVFSNLKKSGQDYLQAFTVLHVTGGRRLFDPSANSWIREVDFKWELDSESEQRNRDLATSYSRTSPFIIDCVYVDSDGRQLAPKARRFVIPPYAAKRSILALDIYPARFDPEYEVIMETLLKRGGKLVSISLGTHKQYSGMSIRESQGEMARHNFIEIHAEEVHSEVMVDQIAGIQYFATAEYPSERFHIRLGGGVLTAPTPPKKMETFDAFPDKVENEWRTDVLDDTALEIDRRSEFLASTDLIKFFDIKDTAIPKNVLRHLCPRVFGYATRIRKWLPLNVELLYDIEHQTKTLSSPKTRYKDLILPGGHKKLLQSLVSFHTQDRGDWYSFENSSLLSMDVVAGKGEGLFILLHGPPGVGKTSTAECVAAQLGCPLLPITCGDLGSNPRAIEKNLTMFCRWAYKWRSVLLLDEADLFLSKRGNNDPYRNATVGVFLRALDYFPGVMIFTSNRVGQIDEAFRSRIHLCLFYPKLDLSSFMRIWERNIARVKRNGMGIDLDEESIRRFSNLLWLENEKNPSRHWNGRQIKNAFQTAITLAHWEFRETDERLRPKRPLLRAQHFKRIGEASAHFDDYIGSLYGLEDQDAYSVLAAREEVRKDIGPVMTFMKSKDDRYRTKRQISRRSTQQDILDETESSVDSAESNDEGEPWGEEANGDGNGDENDDDDDEYDRLEIHKLKRKIAKLERKRSKAKGVRRR